MGVVARFRGRRVPVSGLVMVVMSVMVPMAVMVPMSIMVPMAVAAIVAVAGTMARVEREGVRRFTSGFFRALARRPSVQVGHGADLKP